MPDIFAFLSYVLITTFTPGPNNILSMFNTGKVGLKKGVKFNVGIFIGFTVVMLMCGALGSLLVEYLPSIKPVLKYIGAAYILWLAYKTVKSDYSKSMKDTQSGYSIKEGALLQFVNPKVIIYGLTTLSTFIVPYYKQSMILVFSIALAAVAFIATICWALFGASMHGFLQKHNRGVNIVMCGLLIYTAISLVI